MAIESRYLKSSLDSGQSAVSQPKSRRAPGAKYSTCTAA